MSSDNIFISTNKSLALKLARKADNRRQKGITLSLLDGIPITVKDNIDIAGNITTAGTPGLNTNMPNRNAAIIQKLLMQGAVIIGKTNMHELAAGVTSNNFAYGAVKNPYDKSKFAGGSSGGSAVSVAAGLVPLSLGTDTAGSTRIPASLTGVIGFRPTTNRYPTTGIVPVSDTLDSVGLLAHTASDLLVVDDIIVKNIVANAEPTALNSIRLGVAKSYFYSELDPQTKSITMNYLKLLKTKGIELVDINIQPITKDINAIDFAIAFYEANMALRNYIKTRLPGTSFAQFIDKIASPDVKSAFEVMLKKPVAKLAYREALQKRKILINTYIELFRQNNLDAIIFPTTPLPARDIKDSLNSVTLNGKLTPIVPAYSRNTVPAAVLNAPGLTFNIGYTKAGLPIGIEIDGLPDNDRKLLRLGIKLSQTIHFRE